MAKGIPDYIRNLNAISKRSSKLDDMFTSDRPKMTLAIKNKYVSGKGKLRRMFDKELSDFNDYLIQKLWFKRK